MSVEELCAEASLLSQEDQGTLVAKLIRNLGRPDYDVPDEEVFKRVKETADGSVKDISHEEFMAGLEFIPRK